MRRSERLAQRRAREAAVIWQRNRRELEERARAKRLDGVHHADFFVGAAGVIMTQHNGSHIRCACNFKPQTNGGPRRCAEEPIIEAAREIRGIVAGMVVVGPPKKDDGSGVDWPSTLCCVHCRRKFRQELRKKDGVVKGWTQLLFVSTEHDQPIPMTVAELLELCED